MAKRASWVHVLLVAVALLVAWLTSMAWLPKVVGPETFARYEKTHIFFVGALVLTVFVLAAALWPEINRYLLGGAARERRILATGRPATAIVVSLGENSGGGVVTVNDQPYLNLILEVRDGIRPPYRVSMDLIIPRTAVPQFQPGAVIPVTVDPDDPQGVVINWGG